MESLSVEAKNIKSVSTGIKSLRIKKKKKKFDP